MSRRLLALALVLALSACGEGKAGEEEPPAGQYSVYFLTASDRSNRTGAVLGREFRSLPDGVSEVEGLLGLLLAGPESGDLRSPIPQDTALRSWRVEDGLATVDLSEAYGGLNGVELSLADGCVARTLCQLAEVDRVYLTVEGRPRPFRDQVVSPGDLLLESGLDGPEEVTAELWFLQGSGLEREERTLELSMGDRADVAALQALLRGPETLGLEPVCPEGVKLLSLTLEKGVYTVDLSGGWLLETGEEDPRRLLAVARTLAGITPGGGTRFLVEGRPLESFGGLDLTVPLTGE